MSCSRVVQSVPLFNFLDKLVSVELTSNNHDEVLDDVLEAGDLVVQLVDVIQAGDLDQPERVVRINLV